jgi:hypothetical protein
MVLLEQVGKSQIYRLLSPALVWWPPRLPFKLGDPGSIFARTSTQGLKIIEEEVLPLH